MGSFLNLFTLLSKSAPMKIFITKNETINFTISDKRLGSYELNKKITVARGNGFIFNQINKLKIKTYSN